MGFHEVCVSGPECFLCWKALGSGAMPWIFSVNSLDSLYAGVFLQFTTGRIGWSDLCILISPLTEGAEGCMFVYFHLESFGIRVVLSFVVCLMWVWNVLVGSVRGGHAQVVKYEMIPIITYP